MRDERVEEVLASDDAPTDRLETASAEPRLAHRSTERTQNIRTGDAQRNVLGLLGNTEQAKDVQQDVGPVSVQHLTFERGKHPILEGGVEVSAHTSQNLGTLGRDGGVIHLQAGALRTHAADIARPQSILQLGVRNGDREQLTRG